MTSQWVLGLDKLSNVMFCEIQYFKHLSKLLIVHVVMVSYCIHHKTTYTKLNKCKKQNQQHNLLTKKGSNVQEIKEETISKKKSTSYTIGLGL